MCSNGREHIRCSVPRPPPPPLSLCRDGEVEETVKISRRTQSSLVQSTSTDGAASNVTRKKMLSKQLSMRETTPEVRDKRRRQIQRQRSSMGLVNEAVDMAPCDGDARLSTERPAKSLTDDTKKKMLSKQLSMKETTREVKWEKRRRQIQRQRSSMGLLNEADDMAPCDGDARLSTERLAAKSLTDEDLDELRGSMDLGFRFDEQKGGQGLCDTLPALDLYFAVNRKLSEPKVRWSTSSEPSLSATNSSPNLCPPSPGSPCATSNPMDSWKICSPGDNPQLVKTRLRHWAQVVACSVKHSS